MRVCISYTHPYPIKSLNHTLPIRICKLCFQANMQVASTLWPDIKSKKLSETDSGSDGPKVMQEPNSDKPRQAKTTVDLTRRPKIACWTKLGSVGPPGRSTDLQVGRPGPWAPPPQLHHVSPLHWLLKSVAVVSPRGSLL